MKYKFLCVSAFFVLAVAGMSAQTRHTWTSHCGQPDVVQDISAAAHEGHPFRISQTTCSVSGDFNGVAAKTLTNALYAENFGGQNKNWGVLVETLANGDQVFYNIQTIVTLKNGTAVSGQKTYQITGGTGSMKAISGSGTCTVTYGSGGGSDSTCTGTYKLP
jgi:hypothetical protein